MKLNCEVIRDLLPLYAEELASESSRALVEAHLADCADCRQALEGMRTPKPPLRQSVDPLRRFRGHLRRRAALLAALSAAAAGLLLWLLLFVFPVSHYLDILPYSHTYAQSEMRELLFAGTPADRQAAQGVLDAAEEAFSAVGLTEREAAERFGPLSRYAWPAESYPGAARESHRLDLYSAYCGEETGVLWVHYSQRAYDADGEIISGSADILSRWRIQKLDGRWTVTEIKEAP